jgi:hypothetical protein
MGVGTVISPKIRRELLDVRSIRTATNSHESASTTSVVSDPPYHQDMCSCDPVLLVVVVVVVMRSCDAGDRATNAGAVAGILGAAVWKGLPMGSNAIMVSTVPIIVLVVCRRCRSCRNIVKETMAPLSC